MGMISNCRKSKKCRMGVIWSLMAVVILLLIFWKKGTVALTVILVLLAIAMWVEWFDYDADLGKLWETGSYSESRVETIKNSDWDSIRLITWTCATKDFDLNCSDFSTQADAQAKYDQCAESIKKNNPDLNLDMNKLDIYGLDGNNNWIVCEALK